MSNMDPFEDFQFKPLTDGLGFHKKTKSASSSVSDDLDEIAVGTPTSKGLLTTQLIPENKLSFEENVGPELTTPLPRKQNKIVVDDILTTLKQAPRPDFTNTKSKTFESEVNEKLDKLFESAPGKKLEIKNHDRNKTFDTEKKTKTESFKNTGYSFSASMLDGMLVIAAALLCMIILLLTTRVDLFSNMSNPGDGMVYLSLASLIGGISFIYLTVNRMFLGYTPGEWVFDMRAGTPEQLNNPFYSFKIALRSLVVIATGIITIPIFSAIFNKDIAGQVSGINLLKKA